MAAPDIGTIVPFDLPRDMVRAMFPVDQSDPLPELSSLPDMVWRWNFDAGPGTPVTLTYAFSSIAPAYDPGPNIEDPASYAAYTDAEKANVASVLAAYAGVAGLAFQLVGDAAEAQIVFRKVELLPSGFAFFPPHSSAVSESPSNGDVYLDLDAAGEPYIAFHEIGHALGLGHPYQDGHPHPEDYGFTGGRHLSVVDQGFVPKPFYIVDNGGGSYSRASIFHPTTPMPLDVLALQLLYGANSGTSAGDTLYAYDVNPRFFQTVWDGGGNDTIDLSNQSNPNIISLAPGTYTSIGLRDPFAGLPQSIVDWALSLAPEDRYSDGSNMLAIAFDTVVENAIGGSAGDRLIGNSAANVLDGRAGADTMAGGPANDVYIVDNAADVVTELEGEGTDLVRSAVSYTLGANLERLTLTGTDPIEGTGNLLFNRIVGNAASNTLRGNAGGDTLDGGAGADLLIGGNASDVYVVDDAGDVVSEVGTTGTDWVLSSVSFTLPDAVEYLTLTGTSPINSTGNALANLLLGNAAANVLDGLGGADTMKGGAGDDTYIVDNAADRAVELAGAGSDAVQASVSYRLGANVENLTLTGSSAINGTGNAIANTIVGNDAANVLVGMGGADTLQGGLGNDSLKGGTGNDELTGGAGADVFFFVENPGPGSADVITDFTSGADRMRLDDAKFTAIGALGNFALNDARFVAGAELTGGQDADDRIVHNSTTGALYYDADGDGATAGLLFTTLQGAPALAATDFTVV